MKVNSLNVGHGVGAIQPILGRTLASIRVLGNSIASAQETGPCSAAGGLSSFPFSVRYLLRYLHVRHMCTVS